jgi:hypothetical protein
VHSNFSCCLYTATSCADDLGTVSLSIVLRNIVLKDLGLDLLAGPMGAFPIGGQQVPIMARCLMISNIDTVGF